MIRETTMRKYTAKSRGPTASQETHIFDPTLQYVPGPAGTYVVDRADGIHYDGQGISSES